MNVIRAARKLRGIQLRALANQLQIDWRLLSRIEHGVQPCPFQLGLAISVALSTDLVKLFPDAKDSLGKLGKGKQFLANLHDDQLVEDFASKGIDLGYRIWFFKYHLVSGTVGFFEILESDKRRLFAAVQRTDREDGPFVIFDSKGYRILLNLDSLAYCHFLFDAPTFKEIPNDEADEQDEEQSVVVHLKNDRTPLIFGVEPDVPLDKEDDTGQFGHLFFMADLWDAEHPYVFHFEDVDGEDVFLSPSQLAMMSVRLWVMHPELIGDEDEEHQENNEGEQEPSGSDIRK